VSPKPPPGKVSVHVYLTEETDRRVRHLMADTRASKSAIVEAALGVYLNAIERSADFDAQMSSIRVAAGVTGKDLDALRSAVAKMGAEAAESIEGEPEGGN